MNRKHIFIKILAQIIFHSIILRKSIQYRKGPIFLTCKDHTKIRTIRTLINTLSEQDSI